MAGGEWGGGQAGGRTEREMDRYVVAMCSHFTSPAARGYRFLDGWAGDSARVADMPAAREPPVRLGPPPIRGARVIRGVRVRVRVAGAVRA